MSQFRNWRWYRKYGGGPIVDLGSHQIDIFSWVFSVDPKSVMAGGGVDYYKQHDWYDNVMAIYEYENEEGVARAFYQVLTTTSHGGFGETFMGEDGAIEISEVPSRGNAAKREAHAPEEKWDELALQGDLKKLVAPIRPSATKNVVVDARTSVELGTWPLPIELVKPAHQPHLENFFDAIRLGKPLNCPAEVGYETAVAVLKVNDAVEAGRKLDFAPGEFEV
jgi:predicted dehydrogenase